MCRESARRDRLVVAGSLVSALAAFSFREWSVIPLSKFRELKEFPLCRSKIRFSAVSCSDTGWSSSAVVLVDQAAEYGVSSDPVGFKVGDGCCGRRPGGLRRQLLPGLVGAMPVVVLDVCGEHGMGVGFVEDQDPIEKLAP
jgi:hypothetical protein